MGDIFCYLPLGLTVRDAVVLGDHATWRRSEEERLIRQTNGGKRCEIILDTPFEVGPFDGMQSITKKAQK
jgi:hypothetical protein